MKLWKKVLALALAAAMALSLCACSAVLNKLNEERMIALVQGNLDELYLGKFDEDYLASVSSTPEDAQLYYEDGLSSRAELFEYFFGIEFPTDEMHKEITELCRQIYSNAKYTVGAASQLDENTVVVKVDVDPIDIYVQMVDDIEAEMADFYAKYPDSVVSAMDDAAYMAYDAEWARGIIDLCRKKLDTLSYGDPASVAVQVTLVDDIWCISEDSMTDIETAIITYP